LRPKKTQDGALPCGNSAAAVMFDRLARLTAEERWRSLAASQLDFIAAAGRYPASRAFALTALALGETETRETVAALPDEHFPEELRAILRKWSPEMTVLVKTPARAALLAEAAPFTADMEAADGKARYYLCTGGACAMPVSY